MIDFKRNKFGVPATVKTLEYDPNRSAFIALVEYEDGAKSYILAPDGLKVGDKVMAPPPISSRATLCRLRTSPSVP